MGRRTASPYRRKRIRPSSAPEALRLRQAANTLGIFLHLNARRGEICRIGSVIVLLAILAGALVFTLRIPHDSAVSPYVALYECDNAAGHLDHISIRGYYTPLVRHPSQLPKYMRREGFLWPAVNERPNGIGTENGRGQFLVVPRSTGRLPPSYTWLILRGRMIYGCGGIKLVSWQYAKDSGLMPAHRQQT